METGCFTEANRIAHVRHRQSWCHIDAAGALLQPSDAHSTQLDLVVTQQ
jgi:hypothetical protein